MNIEEFRNTDTDLGHFLKFIESIDREIYVKYEDWEEMCSIYIGEIVGDISSFQFYDDGVFRMILREQSCFNYIRERAISQYQESLSCLSFWGMIKY